MNSCHVMRVCYAATAFARFANPAVGHSQSEFAVIVNLPASTVVPACIFALIAFRHSVMAQSTCRKWFCRITN